MVGQAGDRLRRRLSCLFQPLGRVADIDLHARRTRCIARCFEQGIHEIVVVLRIERAERLETRRVEMLPVPLALDGVHLIPAPGDDEICFRPVSQSPVANLHPKHAQQSSGSQVKTMKETNANLREGKTIHKLLPSRSSLRSPRAGGEKGVFGSL